MSSRSIEEVEAELEVVKLEAQLVEAKGTDAGPSVELKNELREARRVFREMRQSRRFPDGVARPEAIDATTDVNNPTGA